MNLTPAQIARHVPSIAALSAAENGEGLILQGWASTPTLDRVGDIVNPAALERSLKQFLATNPVLLWSHRVSLPPIGKVLAAKIDPVRGLWIEALVPKAADGTLRAEIYSALKDGLLKGFSVGAKWARRLIRPGVSEVYSADIYEISLASTPVGFDTFTDSIQPTEVKAIGDLWLPKSMSHADQIDAVTQHRRHRAVERALDMLSLELTIAELNAAARR